MTLSFSSDFKTNPYEGRYIAIEGIDGSGKSTQIEHICQELEKKGHTVVITGEPRHGQVVEHLIRDILSAKVSIPSAAYQHLYTADRIMNHDMVVLPALQMGKTVISHRSVWSIVPYGGVDIGEEAYNKEMADALFVAQGVFSHFYQFVIPDVTFYLDVHINTAMERLTSMDKQKDIYEKRSKLGKIISGYTWLVETFPDNIVRIDGEKSVKHISEEILRTLLSKK